MNFSIAAVAFMMNVWKERPDLGDVLLPLDDNLELTRVAMPVFLLFSLVPVPTALAIGMAVTGFLTSGALGLGGLSSLTVLTNTMRQAFQRTLDLPDPPLPQPPPQGMKRAPCLGDRRP